MKLSARLQSLVRLSTMRDELHHRIETAELFGVLAPTDSTAGGGAGAARIALLRHTGQALDEAATVLGQDGETVRATEPYEALDLLTGGDHDALVVVVADANQIEPYWNCSATCR